MTSCSLYCLTDHSNTSSTSRSGPAEDTPHPTEPNADAPAPTGTSTIPRPFRRTRKVIQGVVLKE